MSEGMEQLAPELIEEALEKIKKGDYNGDIQETNLRITAAMYEMMVEMYHNPSLVFGRLFQKYPALFIPTVLVGWILAGATALGVIALFAGRLGVVISVP